MLGEEATLLFRYWFDKGLQEGNWDDGTKFFYFYLCLNIAMANLSSENSDRKMLDWVKREENILHRAFQRRLSYEPLIEQLERLKNLSPIVDARSHSSKQVRISERDDFKHVLEAIYQIRCNFFHGNKPTWVDRNQRLIESSTYILKYWLEVIYTRGGNV